MALQRDAKYPNRFNGATPRQPQGGFKNRTTDVSKDGSYLEKDWLNDWSAFFSSLLSDAGITANGDVDEVGASQYFTAFKSLVSNPNVFIDGSEQVNQSEFNGDWSAVTIGEYGSDITKKISSTLKRQPVEELAYIPSTAYTISYPTGSAQITSPSSGDWDNSDLDVPIDSEWYKLEIGTVATGFIAEPPSVNLAKCQRLFQVLRYDLTTSFPGAAGTVTYYFNIRYQVTTRINPLVTLSGGVDILGRGLENTVGKISDTKVSWAFPNSTEGSITRATDKKVLLDARIY